ncbi:MAG: hypothetical protein WAL98_03690 [Desulfatiglandaceae bacterium]
MDINSEIKYFEQKGPKNTDVALKLGKERAEALGIEDVVVASFTGNTGVKASQLFRASNLVVVAGVVGFTEPNKSSMIEENKSKIEAKGGKVLFGGHAFGMLGRAINKQFGAIQIDEVIANVLRLLSPGVKVGCEIACMAVDAGLIMAGKEVMTVAGSGRGADSVTILRASNTHTFFDTRILEIICKPRG